MNVEQISKEYFNWFKQNNQFTLHKDVIELSTPSVDSFGDNINLILKPEGDKIRISDDAYVVWNLESHGLNITKKSKRNNLLNSILSYESVSLDNSTNEIYKISSMKNIGQSIHEVIQSISKITDLMYLNKPNVKSIFSEDVFNYLKENKDDYDYFPNLQIIGQSKLPFNFDALFTTENRVKKLSRFYNSFSKSTMENALLSWLDTIQYREERFDGSLQMAIVVNDENNKKLSREYLDALSEYKIEVIPFSDKQRFRKSLGAS
ncbi:DUF1828 domain-containing protein [Gracilibacillus alcaliphilus]|uniref:DUF1828 domain-containing protein n=1 Tax=Gracilibacillus alcaliphilus TaxID=1401441 RepID=UPI0019568262|nr:DUF1828 domain-containing protein [Gracilibacillus alcaliphilus]MBM7678925.1 DNA polymerase III epsilon subunit-like protein [Gracilibacillus alcaliphilus]